mmetsp:Transcript_114685/g.199465  ORF Transcript_114685/g.199465 Transcript_114685/m.199465 type:complete len:204 (+) Transcript_114685:196-807(+)
MTRSHPKCISSPWPRQASSQTQFLWLSARVQPRVPTRAPGTSMTCASSPFVGSGTAASTACTASAAPWSGFANSHTRRANLPSAMSLPQTSSIRQLPAHSSPSRMRRPSQTSGSAPPPAPPRARTRRPAPKSPHCRRSLGAGPRPSSAPSDRKATATPTLDWMLSAAQLGPGICWRSMSTHSSGPTSRRSSSARCRTWRCCPP